MVVTTTDEVTLLELEAATLDVASLLELGAAWLVVVILEELGDAALDAGTLEDGTTLLEVTGALEDDAGLLECTPELEGGAAVEALDGFPLETLDETGRELLTLLDDAGRELDTLELLPTLPVLCETTGAEEVTAPWELVMAPADELAGIEYVTVTFVVMLEEMVTVMTVTPLDFGATDVTQVPGTVTVVGTVIVTVFSVQVLPLALETGTTEVNVV